MGKPWVKLYTSMLFHEETQSLDGDAFKTWINLILLGGTIDDGGRVGPVGNVAFALHMTRDELAAHLSEMNGRVTVTDGELWIRDWFEWQAMNDRDRKRKQRSGDGNGVTDGHGASRDVTDGHDSHDNRIEKKREEEKREEPKPAADAAPRRKRTTRKAAKPDPWEPFKEAFRESFGLGAVASTWKLAQKAVAVLREHGIEPDDAVGAWQRFESACRADDSWKYVQAHSAFERLGKWLADNANARSVYERTGRIT